MFLLFFIFLFYSIVSGSFVISKNTRSTHPGTSQDAGKYIRHSLFLRLPFWFSVYWKWDRMVLKASNGHWISPHAGHNLQKETPDTFSHTYICSIYVWCVDQRYKIQFASQILFGNMTWLCASFKVVAQMPPSFALTRHMCICYGFGAGVIWQTSWLLT